MTGIYRTKITPSLGAKMSLSATTLLGMLIVSSNCDIYGLKKETKSLYVEKIIELAEQKGEDPYELLAIAITESSLKPNAYSHTKDVGLFQINCKWWYKKFKYSSIKTCETGLMNPVKNIQAGIHVLTSYRARYKQCKGVRAYRCYNGGPGWPRSKNISKIKKYELKVRSRKEILHKHYKEHIENVRMKYRRQI